MYFLCVDKNFIFSKDDLSLGSSSITEVTGQLGFPNYANASAVVAAARFGGFSCKNSYSGRSFDNFNDGSCDNSLNNRKIDVSSNKHLNTSFVDNISDNSDHPVYHNGLKCNDSTKLSLYNKKNGVENKSTWSFRHSWFRRGFTRSWLRKSQQSNSLITHSRKKRNRQVIFITYTYY